MEIEDHKLRLETDKLKQWLLKSGAFFEFKHVDLSPIVVREITPKASVIDTRGISNTTRVFEVTINPEGNENDKTK